MRGCFQGFIGVVVQKLLLHKLGRDGSNDPLLYKAVRASGPGSQPRALRLYGFFCYNCKAKERGHIRILLLFFCSSMDYGFHNMEALILTRTGFQIMLC